MSRRFTDISPLREWGVLYAGHRIQVTLRWWLRVELRVDGQLLDRRSLLVATDSNIPLLTARMPSAPLGARLINVHIGVWSPTPELQIEAKRIPLTDLRRRIGASQTADSADFANR